MNSSTPLFGSSVWNAPVYTNGGNRGSGSAGSENDSFRYYDSPNFSTQQHSQQQRRRRRKRGDADYCVHMAMKAVLLSPVVVLALWSIVAVVFSSKQTQNSGNGRQQSKSIQRPSRRQGSNSAGTRNGQQQNELLGDIIEVAELAMGTSQKYNHDNQHLIPVITPLGAANNADGNPLLQQQLQPQSGSIAGVTSGSLSNLNTIVRPRPHPHPRGVAEGGGDANNALANPLYMDTQQQRDQYAMLPQSQSSNMLSAVQPTQIVSAPAQQQGQVMMAVQPAQIVSSAAMQQGQGMMAVQPAQIVSATQQMMSLSQPAQAQAQPMQAQPSMQVSLQNEQLQQQAQPSMQVSIQNEQLQQQAQPNVQASVQNGQIQQQVQPNMQVSIQNEQLLMQQQQEQDQQPFQQQDGFTQPIQMVAQQAAQPQMTKTRNNQNQHQQQQQQQQQNENTVYYYYDPRHLTQNKDGMVILPDRVYDTSGNAHSLSSLRAREILLQPPALGAVSSPAMSSTGGNGTASQDLPIPPPQMQLTNPINKLPRWGESNATDQSIIVCTVGVMALLVGALSARRLRKKNALSVCIENETLEDEIAYDSAYTIQRDSYRTFEGWKGDLEKFDV